MVDQFPPKQMQVITLHRFVLGGALHEARASDCGCKLREKDLDEVTCNAINSGVEFHIQTQLLM